MLKLNIEEKLMTTVDKLYAFRTVKSVYLCNLLEKEERELSVQDGVLYVQMKPFEIITLKVR